MRKLRSILTFTLAASLCFAAASGCSDDSANRIVLDDDFYNNVPGGEEGNNGSENGNNNGGGGHEYIPHENTWEVVLVPAMVTDVDMANKGSAKLRVQLVSIVDDETLSEGVADQPIDWAIEDDSQLVTIKQRMTFTNEVGVADVTVTAGANEGDVRVIVSNERSPKPVYFNISVGPVPTGNMRVIASYTGYAPIVNYSIRLYDRKDADCSQFSPDDLPTAEPLMTADNSYTTFQNLSIEGNYTAVAYGYAANGAMVALGCTTSGTKIIEKQTSEVYVPMKTIDLNPSSTYHVRSYFDFGDIVSSLGSVGKMIAMITNFAANPGATLYDILWNDILVTALNSIIPSWVTGGLTKVLEWTGIDDKIAGWLNDFVKSNSTGCKIGLFGCQLRNIVRTMELTGDLSIQKVGDLQLNGKNAYSGLSVYWRIGCENSSDPNCGRYHYSMDSLNLGTQVNVLEGSWNGSLSNGYDRISIESHDLAMYYGKLVMFLINDILLPRIAGGAHNFNDAIANWINCNSMATWLANNLKLTVPDWVPFVGGDSIWDGPGWDTAYGWCKSVSSTLGSILNFASSMATLQKLNSNVSISGSGIMKDTSLDNVVDVIEDGHWNGSMTLTTKNDDGTTTTTSTAVMGIWSAYNKLNDGYCTYDKTSTDASDQLCSFPPIDTTMLVSDGLCAEYAKCAN